MSHVEHEPGPSMWATASFGHSPDVSALEMSELRTHLTRCRVSAERLILHRAVQSLREFIAAHFVTTITAITVLVLLFRFWS